MDYHETPSGKQAQLGVIHDIAGINRQLDSLRALAYRDGEVAPLFTDGDAPKAGPWDTKEELTNSLAEALGRLKLLKQPHASLYIGDALCQQAQWLHDDICFQCNAFEKAGFISFQEKPQEALKLFHDETASMKDLLPLYTSLAMKGPAPTVDTRGAVIAPLGSQVSLQKI